MGQASLVAVAAARTKVEAASTTEKGYSQLDDAAEPAIEATTKNEMLLDFLTPPVKIRLDSTGQHTVRVHARVFAVTA